jgi:hypothetical protein
VRLLTTGPVALQTSATQATTSVRPPRTAAKQRGAGRSPPLPASKPSEITRDQKDALAKRIALSQFTVNRNERRALCRSIGLDPNLPLVESDGKAFGEELIEHLVNTMSMEHIHLLVLKLVELYVNDPLLQNLITVTRG